MNQKPKLDTGGRIGIAIVLIVILVAGYAFFEDRERQERIGAMNEEIKDSLMGIHRDAEKQLGDYEKVLNTPDDTIIIRRGR